MAPSLMVAAWAIGAGLSAIRATAAGSGLYDLVLFACTGVLDKVPDVDDALMAGVGALEGGVVRLYSVVVVVGVYPTRVHSYSPFCGPGPGRCQLRGAIRLSDTLMVT